MIHKTKCIIPFDAIKKRICDAVEKDLKPNDFQLANMIINYDTNEITMDCFSEECVVAEHKTSNIERIVFK